MIRDIIMPKLGETMEEGYLSAWKKEEGERVEKGDVLFEVMSDKTNFDVESPHAGYLRKKLREPSDEAIAVTTVIGYLADSPDEPLPAAPPSTGTPAAAPAPAQPATAAAAAPGQPARTAEAPPQAGRPKASPLARRLAADRGIELSLVRGTGPGGRIEKEDVLAFESAAGPKAPAAADYEIIPWTPVRRIIAERLGRSKATIPHFYLEGTVVMDRAAALRAPGKEGAAAPTFTDIIVFFAAAALKEFPLLNAAVVDGEARAYRTLDIGLAVALEDGLIVPVLRDCAGKGLAEIAALTADLAARARSGKLTRAETENSRFIVSNLGMFGVDSFQAIISPPGVAIMGVGGIRKSPVVEDGSVVVRSTMGVSLSLDHRLIDGAYGARFFKRFKELIEAA